MDSVAIQTLLLPCSQYNNLATMNWMIGRNIADILITHQFRYAFVVGCVRFNLR